MLQTCPSLPQCCSSSPHWSACTYLGIILVIPMLLFPLAPHHRPTQGGAFPLAAVQGKRGKSPQWCWQGHGTAGSTEGVCRTPAKSPLSAAPGPQHCFDHQKLGGGKNLRRNTLSVFSLNLYEFSPWIQGLFSHEGVCEIWTWAHQIFWIRQRLFPHGPCTPKTSSEPSTAFFLPQLHSSATVPWHPTDIISFKFLYAERALCAKIIPSLFRVAFSV